MQVYTQSEARELYDELLNDVYPAVSIGYSTFDAADVLRTMDPTCYEIGFTEYCDGAADDESFLVEGYTDDRLEEETEE